MGKGTVSSSSSSGGGSRKPTAQKITSATRKRAATGESTRKSTEPKRANMQQAALFVSTAQKILSQFRSSYGSPYAFGLLGSFNAHAESKKSAKVFYLRYKSFKGVKILRRAGGKLCFEHPDNPKNLLEVTPETFASAMARVRQDYELARGKQPNARMKGKSAKDGFHKNVAANNDAYSPDGKDMHKWTSATYWGTDESRGTSGTVNEAGYDFMTGKTVLCDEDGAAFDKRDFGIEDMEREVQDLGTDSEGEEEDSDVIDLTGDDTVGASSSTSSSLRALQKQRQKQHLVQVKQELSVAEEEREAAQSRLQCAVCMEAERDTVLLPCSHVVACAGCATRLTQCPVCRAEIHSRVMARMS